MTAVSFLEGGLQGGRVLPGEKLSWLKARRDAGAERFNVLGLPTPKLEGWKYTRLRPLDDTCYTPISDTAEDDAIADLPSIGDVAARIVFVNGKLRTDLSRFDALPDGVRFGPLEDFLAVHGHVLRRSDADANLVALDAQHRDGDRVTDHQGLSHPSRQNQHPLPSRYVPAPARMARDPRFPGRARRAA